MCRSTRPPNAPSIIRPSDSRSRCCAAGRRRLIDGQVAYSLVTWTFSKITVQRMVSLAMLSNTPTDSVSRCASQHPGRMGGGCQSEYRKIKRPFPPTTRTYPVAHPAPPDTLLRHASTRETCESENPNWLKSSSWTWSLRRHEMDLILPVRGPLLSGIGLVGRIETAALRRCEPDAAMVLVASFRHRQAHPSGVAAR